MATHPSVLVVAGESPSTAVLTFFVFIKAHGALFIRSTILTATAAICARRCALYPPPTTQKPAAHRWQSESETKV